MINKRYFRYFDWVSFCITIVLLLIGLLFVFSSTYSPENKFSLFFKKQLIGSIVGFGIYFFFFLKDNRCLMRLGYFAYFGVIALLIYTIFAGWIAMGAGRWVSLYFFRGQPSELAKLFLPAFIAFCVNCNNEPINPPLKKFAFPTLALLLSVLLILKQPDLGTALLLLTMGFAVLWIAGLPKKIWVTFILFAFASAPIMWKMLKSYQKQRIIVLFGYGNNKKEGYQIEQSKIAIGSGGLTGKGLLQGTQNKLAFLPEDHTDFIFSVIGEEWGFFGVLLILCLFCILFLRILRCIMQLTNFSEIIISFGLVIHLILSVCINIGMVVGLLPIVGIPLPLFSYGNSNLWVTLATLGWLNNISVKRFYF